MLARIVERGGEFPAGEFGSGARLLGKRQHHRLADLDDGALRFHFEAANGFDFIAEEFDAQGAGIFRGVHIENAAADGILAGHLDRLAPLIADGFEMRLDHFERHFLARAQFDREARVEGGGVGARERGS